MQIYICKNIINDKFYIGKTKRTIEKRKKEHIADAFFYNSKNLFHMALRKYGIENFEWKTMAFCDNEEELSELEEFFISEMRDSFGKNFLYNMTSGGEGLKNPCDITRKRMSESRMGEKNHRYGKPISEKQRLLAKMRCGENHYLYGKKHLPETIEKMKIAHAKENNGMYGKKHSDCTKKIISEKHKGKTISEEHKNKISNSLKGRVFSEETIFKMKNAQVGEKHPMYGKKHTEESRRKMSENSSGEKNPNYGKCLSEEQKKKIGDAHRGKKISEEQKKIISERHKGKKISEETRLKMRLSALNRKNKKTEDKK